MPAKYRKRRPPVDRGRYRFRVVVILSLLAVTFGTAWFARNSLYAPAPPPVVAAPGPVTVPPEKYVGVVQLAPDRQGRCEQLEIDNRSGATRSKGSARCDEIMFAPPSEAARGRLENVGGFFKPH